MSLVSLTLDEIAALRRGNSNVPLFPKKKYEDRPKFNKKSSDSGLKYGRSKTVPEGKWDHSGFEELCRTEAYVPRRGSQTYSRIDLTKKVVLHITNLAPSVNSDDLNELFEEYPLLSVTVNYDETGKSVGTADIISDRPTIKEIMANYDGATLDGKAMKFFLIEEEPTRSARNSRARDHSTFSPYPRNTSTYRQSPKKVLSGKIERSGRERLAMTSEDLDRELEEYMRKSEC